MTQFALMNTVDIIISNLCSSVYSVLSLFYFEFVKNPQNALTSSLLPEIPIIYCDFILRGVGSSEFCALCGCLSFLKKRAPKRSVISFGKIQHHGKSTAQATTVVQSPTLPSADWVTLNVLKIFPLVLYTFSR
jgi:hypothetical protein